MGLKEEYEVLQHLGKHTNIAAVEEIFQDEQFYYIVQDLYQGGDFTTLQHRAQKASVSMTESWWKGIFRQCFEGLHHIHQHADAWRHQRVELDAQIRQLYSASGSYHRLWPCPNCRI